MRRKGPGVGGLKRNAERKKYIQERGAELQEDKVKHASEMLETFREKLEEFSRKHKQQIIADPVFRHQFQLMCETIGVDPLASSSKGTSLWGEMLGLSHFYNELGVRIVEACLITRPTNGGLLPMDELISHLNHRRRRHHQRNGGDKKKGTLGSGGGGGGLFGNSKNEQGAAEPEDISEDDVKRAVKQLSCLGSGIGLLTLGPDNSSKQKGKVFIQSVPLELDPDTTAVLSWVAASVPLGGPVACADFFAAPPQLQGKSEEGGAGEETATTTGGQLLARPASSSAIGTAPRSAATAAAAAAADTPAAAVRGGATAATAGAVTNELTAAVSRSGGGPGSGGGLAVAKAAAVNLVEERIAARRAAKAEQQLAQARKDAIAAVAAVTGLPVDDDDDDDDGRGVASSDHVAVNEGGEAGRCGGGKCFALLDANRSEHGELDVGRAVRAFFNAQEGAQAFTPSPTRTLPPSPPPTAMAPSSSVVAGSRTCSVCTYINAPPVSLSPSETSGTREAAAVSLACDMCGSPLPEIEEEELAAAAAPTQSTSSSLNLPPPLPSANTPNSLIETPSPPIVSPPPWTPPLTLLTPSSTTPTSSTAAQGRERRGGRAGLGWGEDRARRALVRLAKEGMAWVDTQGGGTTAAAAAAAAGSATTGGGGGPSTVPIGRNRRVPLRLTGQEDFWVLSLWLEAQESAKGLEENNGTASGDEKDGDEAACGDAGM